MQKWAVAIDDPTMATSHGFILEADEQSAALFDGAQRAIRRDRLGCGTCAVPKGANAQTYVVPAGIRDDQANDSETVQTVARFGVAAKLDES